MAVEINVNTGPTHARGSGRRGERNEITSKRGQVDREGGVHYRKLREVTTGCEGRRERDKVEGDTHLGVMVFICIVLDSGQDVSVVGGDIA